MYQPANNEYASFYEGYIQKVKGKDIITYLEEQPDKTADFLSQIPEDKHDYAYAENKWTVKEVLAHIIDTERIMACRTLRFSRNDQTDLPGFDQDLYIENTCLRNRSFSSLCDELMALRKANLFFYQSLDFADFSKGGRANGLFITVGALLFVIAGHLDHHLAVLEEKYLSNQ